MVGGMADRLLELGRPAVERLAGAGIDQVEGKPRKDLARQADRRQRLFDIVQPAEQSQIGVVQRLHAERDAVDAGRAIAAEARGLDRRGICLQRDLGAAGHGPVACHRIEHRGDRFRLHQRRRAAAEEDAGHLARSGAGAHRRKLGREGRREALLVDRLVADMAVEVAIGAFGRAERPVHIDAEAGAGLAHAGPSLARANFWKARARCDSASAWPGFQPCFCSAVISPNVLSWPSGRNTGS